MSTTPQAVTVTESGIRLRQRIEAGRHVLVADEPREAGGGDSGPDPYALLLASLGAMHVDDPPPLRRPQGLAA